jgi:G:T-mismatch repair DNA endonuclease (very short patch repair protein)
MGERLFRQTRPDVAQTPGSHFCAWLFLAPAWWGSLAASPVGTSHFWSDKFTRNIARDMQAQETLLNEGWRVATVWDCELRGKGVSTLINELAACLVSTGSEIELPAPLDVCPLA